MIQVTVWNEYRHERTEPAVAAVYPQGIHGAIAQMLGREADFTLRTATLEEADNGLPQDVLDKTDVLIWWGHLAHGEVADDTVRRVVDRVRQGMGFIALHSGHMSRPFMALMGTSCNLRWREADEKERLWVVSPGHPIVQGLGTYLELPQEETYGEFFDIPEPDETVFISWFSGGEVFRSGCCFHRGAGRIFYFRPGHESYPTFYREDVTRVLCNAVRWAAPQGTPAMAFGHMEAPEKAT